MSKHFFHVRHLNKEVLITLQILKVDLRYLELLGRQMKELGLDHRQIKEGNLIEKNFIHLGVEDGIGLVEQGIFDEQLLGIETAMDIS